MGQASISGGIGDPNPFLANRPELLKYESQNALSQRAPEIGNSNTPNVPDLKSDAPFKLAKTQLPDKQVSVPQVQSAQAAHPLGASYRDILASEQNGQSNVVYGAVTAQQPVVSVQPIAPAPVFVDPNNGRYPLLPSTQTVPTTGSYQVVQPQLPQATLFQQVPQIQQYPTQTSWAGPAVAQNPVMQPHPLMSTPNFRHDLGFRSATPTIRHPGTFDTGEKFDFEDKKKQYPPLSEILKTGRYFYSAGVRFVRPHFQNNTGIITKSSSFVEGITLDHDFEIGPHYRFGFESKFGPGIEFDYFRYDETSNESQFTSNGGVTGEVPQVPGRGLGAFGAFNAGETLSATHTFDFETFGVSFFKEVKLPISRINGRFGLQYVSIAQNLDATLTDATGEIGTYNSRFDFRGFGPKFTLEYYRPIGHTKLEFVTSGSGAVALGRRDEFVDNSLGQGFSRVGADELLTSIEFFTGVQFKKQTAENRAIFARFGTTYSTWLGGGTANDPQSDFGLRGFTFDIGYNR